jgi:hypothetical protein
MAIAPAAPDSTRVIGGQRYGRARGQLFQLGEPVPRGRPHRGLGVWTSDAEAVTPAIAIIPDDVEGDLERRAVELAASPFDAREPDRVRDEVEQLERQGLHHAAAVVRGATGLTADEPLGRYDLGRILTARATFQPRGYSKFQGNAVLTPTLSVFNPEFVREALRRHANGDHGLTGVAEELTDDQIWAPAIAGWPARNRMAALAGSGPIRSSYPVDLLTLARARGLIQPRWICRSQIETLEIASVLGRITLCWPGWSCV